MRQIERYKRLQRLYLTEMRIPPWLNVENAIDKNRIVLKIVEYIASAVLIGLFAIGVFDLILQIYELGLSGRITNPSSVIGLIDTVLLLFIIVELHETVIAYAEEEGLNRVVTIVLYTAIIAIARKFIIFRTGEYATGSDALLAAAAYGIIGVSLGVLLFVFNRYTTAEDYGPTSDEEE